MARYKGQPSQTAKTLSHHSKDDQLARIQRAPPPQQMRAKANRKHASSRHAPRGAHAARATSSLRTATTHRVTRKLFALSARSTSSCQVVGGPSAARGATAALPRPDEPLPAPGRVKFCPGGRRAGTSFRATADCIAPTCWRRGGVSR